MSNTKTKDDKKSRHAAIEALADQMTARLNESEKSLSDLYFTGLNEAETKQLAAAQALVEERDAVALPAMVQAIGASILNAGMGGEDSATLEASVMGKRTLAVTVDLQKTDGGQDSVAVSAGLKTGFTAGAGDIRAARHKVMEMFNDAQNAANAAIEDASKVKE